MLILSIAVLFMIGKLNAEINENQDESTQLRELLKDGHSLVLLFTEPCCACTDCVEAEVLLGGMSKELEENLDLLVVRLKTAKLKRQYGIKNVPKLIYVRENKTAVYSGKFEFETLYMWLQDNRQPATVDLNDLSFEHLTQAATGATTGDWLVIFHDALCCKNRELIHLETAGTQLRNKVNVASVNILDSPETKERFKIKSCPQIIFFRHQRMYRYSLPDVNAKSLKRFAEGFYKNSKAESVPPPPSMFFKIVDHTIKFYKDNMYVIFSISIVLLIIIGIFLYIYSILKSNSHDKEE